MINLHFSKAALCDGIVASRKMRPCLLNKSHRKEGAALQFCFDTKVRPNAPCLGKKGLEPLSLRLSGAYSYQLSYLPRTTLTLSVHIRRTLRQEGLLSY